MSVIADILTVYLLASGIMINLLLLASLAGILSGRLDDIERRRPNASQRFKRKR